MADLAALAATGLEVVAPSHRCAGSSPVTTVADHGQWSTGNTRWWVTWSP